MNSGTLTGFFRMTLADKLALVLVWPVLGFAALLLKLFAFKRLAPLFGQQIGAVGCVPLADPRQTDRARLVRRAVRRAAQVSPWRNDCLPQALTAAMLCRLLSIPVTTHLGLRIDGSSPLEAHAWTCSGQVAVTGGTGFDQWVPVSCFVLLSKR